MKLIIPELPGTTGRQQILPFGASTMADEAIKQNGPIGHSKMPDKGKKGRFYETH